METLTIISEQYRATRKQTMNSILNEPSQDSSESSKLQMATTNVPHAPVIDAPSSVPLEEALKTSRSRRLSQAGGWFFEQVLTAAY